MKTTFLKSIVLISLLTVISCEEQATFSQSRNFSEWLAKPVDKREGFEELEFAQTALNKEEVSKITTSLIADRNSRLKEEYASAWETRKLTIGAREMPFFYRIFGEKPTDGRSLYISLHGGGGTTAAANNQQYQNQQRLYDATMNQLEGVYLAPRAATNTWDLWHQPHVDNFMALIIQLAVINLDVNPNKVYLLGYSAGGDGVYQLAPRMADRWAAASMMAGHPNDASPLNLRNTPFALHMGAEDSAFDRNLKAAEWKELLKNLQGDNPEIYQHQVVIHEGKGHWMELQDAVALPWMAGFRRNTLPQKVVWKQDDVHREQLYWLGVPKELAETGGEVIAEYNKATNEINILENYSDTLQLFINDEMLNLDKPITVKFQGEVIGSKQYGRTLQNLYESLEQSGDTGLVFSTEITVTKNEKVN